ncbi:hypothetical protein SAMN06297144_1420 [Sphingomonas guangdongensis]|uniref:Uncharacterized protein n=1 Tax=Sphingomonas guangdongensis TaxID=1141890 RepID=A0A285QH29_9SPHN|nr:hypothetical protein [Sphingomonas guangdongensis]SOB81146.1 hypothetical protein SAMN06297144_1420 [Sphingomonas guangdongensis]
MQNILLLTATIAPKSGTQSLTHANPIARLQNYVDALNIYLGELDRGTMDHLVFAENSGHPLAALEAQVAAKGLTERVTFLSSVSPLGPDNPRFFLELDLLCAAFSDARLPAFPPDARFWKVTGRYVIRNVREIVRTAPADADIYVNSRTYPVKWSEFFIAAFNQRAFDLVFAHNLERFRTINNGEELLFHLLNEEPPAALTIVQRFRRVVSLSGQRGWDGRRYDDLRGRFGRAVRIVANRLAPGLWI